MADSPDFDFDLSEEDDVLGDEERGERARRDVFSSSRRDVFDARARAAASGAAAAAAAAPAPASAGARRAA